MISYSTNYMGPINVNWWIERGLDVNKDHYYGGRIDIYGLDESEYYAGKSETGLPIMTGESYQRFSDWLKDFETEEPLAFEEIKSEYEKTNPPLQFAPPKLKEE